MIYKNFRGLELSALGLGTMRLPTVGGNDSEIDSEKAAEIFDCALKGGVNYFDTAWFYHGGNAEIETGKILGNYPRDSFYLATKFPSFKEDFFKNKEEIFEKQLEKCGVRHFDFYLFHNVWEKNIDWFENPQFKMHEFAEKLLADGKIRHFGFSTHGSIETMRRFLKTFGDLAEFCQIQLNYFDYTHQNAKEKLSLLKEYNLPVWVMEPLRGGKIASLPSDEESILKSLRKDESIPAWGFRFLQTIPEVCVTLSGMSDLAQVKENIKTFESEKPLSDTEFCALMDIAKRHDDLSFSRCTACRYCTEVCPQELNIPKLLSIYSKNFKRDSIYIPYSVLSDIPKEKYPEHCISCKKCEGVCPQKISISSVLKEFDKKLD